MKRMLAYLFTRIESKGDRLILAVGHYIFDKSQYGPRGPLRPPRLPLKDLDSARAFIADE